MMTRDRSSARMMRSAHTDYKEFEGRSALHRGPAGLGGGRRLRPRLGQTSTPAGEPVHGVTGLEHPTSPSATAPSGARGSRRSPRGAARVTVSSDALVVAAASPV